MTAFGRLLHHFDLDHISEQICDNKTSMGNGEFQQDVKMEYFEQKDVKMEYFEQKDVKMEYFEQKDVKVEYSEQKDVKMEVSAFEQDVEDFLADSGSAEAPGRDDDRKLFVGGLSWESTDKDLMEHFSKFGDIESIKVKTDVNTGRSRGFAFIVFSSGDAIDKVLSSGDDHVINNKKVDPKKAQARHGKIFVGGLIPELSDDDIKNFFAQFGSIVEVEMPFDKPNNRRKGFCFVTFESQQVAQEVLKTPKLTINGKEVDVKKVTPKPQPMRGMRGGWGGRGGARGGWGRGRGGGGYGNCGYYDYVYDPYGYGGYNFPGWSGYNYEGLGGARFGGKKMKGIRGGRPGQQMPFTTVKKKKIPGERRIRRRCGRKGSHCCCHGQRKIAEFMVDLRIRLAVEREGKRRADHFLLEKSMLHNLAYPQPQFVQKKERVANKLRLEGNEKLLKCGASTVEEVLMLFTESLAYAPVGHECVALAYANRAIALHKGGYYLAAIADNQRALNAGYPEHLRYKIYARQGKIYRAMEQNGRALKCYNLALGYLEKSRLDAGDRLKLQETDIDPALDELLGAEEEEEDFVDLTHDPSIGVEEIEVPSFGDKFNPEVPALSASVSLKYSETFGRHLVANRPIQAGEILIIEKPFAAILFEEFQYCNCSHCFKHCVALLPCPNCNWGMGFVIKKIVVHSEPTRVRGGEAHYNMVRDKWDVRNLLEVFSRFSFGSNKEHCLRHLFTHQTFHSPRGSSTVLGLAYIASSRWHGHGGICSHGLYFQFALGPTFPSGISVVLLGVFSREYSHKDFCLAHLFTDLKFEGGILGLAYVGSPRRNSVGGICTPVIASSTVSPCCHAPTATGEQCRDEAEAYHSVECSLMPAIMEMEIFCHGLPLRMISHPGVQKLKEYFRSEMEDWDTEVTEELGSTLDPSKTYEERRTAGFDENGQYISSNPSTVANLCYHKFPKDHSHGRHFYRYNISDSVASVIKLLKLEKSDWAWKLHEFVVRFIESMSCNGSNAINQFVLKDNDLEHLGPSMYPTYGLLNHSCCSNASYHFYGTTLVVRACRSIAKGEQITQGSGKYFLNYGKKYREKYQQERNMFTCKCEACLEDWPLFYDLEGLPNFNVSKKLFLSNATLSRDCEFDDDSNYIITDENIEMFRAHLGILEKYKQTMNQQYYLIQECLRYYYRRRGNRVKDYNPRIPKNSSVSSLSK
ncbi:hypothetical protein B566_EDAN013890 [Ephemera danica]|nr:hypothetical protein B566_EDAN013890 [Ephemera danica]